MIKIALVIIVKNEEKVLERCLKSLAPIGIDKYVVCDTGSTDDSVEIAESFGAEVHKIEFTDYVRTKNEALELAGDADYVLWMDADEYFLSGADKVREYAERGIDVLLTHIVEGTQTEFARTYFRARLWKNDGQHKFDGPGVHEVITLQGALEYDSNIQVMHEHGHRTPEENNLKFQGYRNILAQYLQEHPKDPRATFYMGRTLNDLNFPLLAIDQYEAYLTLGTSFRDERWQAAYDIAECYKHQGEYDLAAEACKRADDIDPRRAEHWCLMGQMSFVQQDWDGAIIYYEKAASIPVPSDVMLFLDPRAHWNVPLDQLVICYDKLRQYRKALETYHKLYGHGPTTDQRLINNLNWLHGRVRKKIFFALGNTPESVYGKMIEEKGVGGVETTYIELPIELSKLGHEVFVFCKCEQEHITGGVRFIPFNDMAKYTDLNPDVIITSRWFDALYLPGTANAKKIIWLQDSHFADPNHADAWDIADAVVVSSRWHSQYVSERLGHTVRREKLHVLPLGIRKAQFAKTVERDPLQVIYSSNPDRGLYILMDMWGEITKRVPGIHLVVTYGWEGLKTWSGSPEWIAQQESNRKRVEAWANRVGNVRITGRLKKEDLYTEMLGSSLCLYANNFSETACCHPNNEVFAVDGYKKVSDINIGEYLLTHKGRFRRVSNTMVRNHSGDIVTLSLQNMKNGNGSFTPEHPILAIPRKQAKAIRMAQLGLQGYSRSHLQYEPVWMPIGNVRPGDFICSPGINNDGGDGIYDLLPDLETLFSGNHVSGDGRIRWRERGNGAPRFVDLDNDFARYLGLYMAEGCYANGTIVFAFHEDEKELIEFVIQYSKNLGLNPQRTYKEKDGKAVSVKISGTIMGKWLEQQVGRGARNKKVPGFVYHQDRDFIRSFLRGVIDGDGCPGKNTVALEMVTRSGIRGIRMLMFSVGISSSLSHQPRFDSWKLDVSNSQIKKLTQDLDGDVGQKASLYHGGQFYYRVKSSVRTLYSGPVYNFEVEEDNSYVSDFMSVHNCLSALETQAAGVPMITTYMGALQNTLDHNNNILIKHDPFSKEYKDEFIRETERLMNDSATRNKMASGCRDYVAGQPLDWSDIALLWEKLIFDF